MEVARFFYKDMGLACSLYSQMFSGLLERMDVSKTTAQKGAHRIEGEGTGGVDVPFLAKGEIGGKLASSTEKQTGQGKTEYISPHDLILLDVMAKLRPSMRLALSECEYGNVFYVKGSFTFIPREMQKTFIETSVDGTLNIISKGAEQGRKKSIQGVRAYLQKFMDSPGEDVRFYFKAEEGAWCSGFLNASAMTESELSLFSKYRSNPIPAHMVGIYERTLDSNTSALEVSPVIKYLHQLAAVTTNMWNHGIQDIIATLPLALFYSISVSPDDGE